MVLGIPLNLNLNAGYKQGGFFKTLLEKSFKFILNRRSNAITFNLSFLLLLAKIDLIAKKYNCKKNTFRACDTSRVEIILALLTKVVALYI